MIKDNSNHQCKRDCVNISKTNLTSLPLINLGHHKQYCSKHKLDYNKFESHYLYIFFNFLCILKSATNSFTYYCMKCDNFRYNIDN